MPEKRKTLLELEAIQSQALRVSAAWYDGIDLDLDGVDLGFCLQFIMMDALGQLFRKHEEAGDGG